MKLSDEMPVDHRLGRVYRYGAGFTGLVLMVFGVLGYADQLAFFDTSGEKIAGLSTNGALSTISMVVGGVLIAGAVVGGNLASTLNITVGSAFILSGFVNLALIGKDANILAFEMPNVIFSFIVGLMVLTFGLYGRVSGNLPHDNPYWRSRHPEQAAREDAFRAALASGRSSDAALAAARAPVPPTTDRPGGR
ncbi:DUF4383 domain-containing protein [Yinghuangia sp. YIM S09857]|uniref:DUF4383 domain-containing protein n=1 Tax=Yinghuangia sp. YIM S09857 TaxID=3436929 RepID=UPI003F529788